MGTPENLALLDDASLLSTPPPDVRPTDLLIVVRAESAMAAGSALAKAEGFFRRDRTRDGPQLRPRSIEAATHVLPEARFAIVSVAGRYAAGVARDALGLGLHVFLYSDNVTARDEVDLKRSAAEKGLLVMGPDCGTSLVGGIGLGFANRVRRGDIGIVAASGTGLQVVACAIHELGAGISQAIGTGGRDTSAEVGAATALQALDLLRRDPATRVIVLISKPPAEAVAKRLLAAAARTGKPTVVAFQGYRQDDRSRASRDPAPAPGEAADLAFAADLGEAGAIAAALSRHGSPAGEQFMADLQDTAMKPGRRWRVGRKQRPLAPRLRGLFSGGTLALEVLQKLQGRLDPLYSNLAAEGAEPLEDAERSQAHTVIDLGSDEFTVGRPHPMIDFDLRTRRLLQEAAQPEVGLILLDVILGYGAHADPAAELAPVITEAARPDLDFVAVVVGTDEDPQGLGEQIARLEDAGVVVFRRVEDAVGYAVERLEAHVDAPAGDAQSDSTEGSEREAIETEARELEASEPPAAVSLSAFEPPIAAINIGVEVFGESLITQGADVAQVDWRPPAGGDARLMEILEKLGR